MIPKRHFLLSIDKPLTFVEVQSEIVRRLGELGLPTTTKIEFDPVGGPVLYSVYVYALDERR